MNMEVTNEIDSRIIGGLRNLEKGEGELSRLARVYRELLQIQMEAKLTATVVRPNLDENLVRERLCEGIPLLLYEDFHPDWNQVQTVFKQILAWSAMDSDTSFEMDEGLRNIGSQPDLFRKAVEAWYRGLSLKTFPVAQRIDVPLLASVLGATLKPFLLAYSRVFMPKVDQEQWRRRVCPICGGKPDFTTLKEGGARWLLCSRCDGEWLFSRIECPYCGTRNQASLAYFTREEKPGLHRLHVCEECHSYIKGIDLRVAGSEAPLPLERMLTWDLDRQGQERGYRPGWLIRESNGGHFPS